MIATVLFTLWAGGALCLGAFLLLIFAGDTDVPPILCVLLGLGWPLVLVAVFAIHMEDAGS